MSHCFYKYIITYNCKVGENLIGSYKDITHETHTIIFTNSRKRASGLTPGVFQGMYFEVFISFRALFWHHYKGEMEPFQSRYNTATYHVY